MVQPRGQNVANAAAAATQEEEKQVVDYGDQFDYRAGAAGGAAQGRQAAPLQVQVNQSAAA